MLVLRVVLGVRVESGHSFGYVGWVEVRSTADRKKNSERVAQRVTAVKELLLRRGIHGDSRSRSRFPMRVAILL